MGATAHSFLPPSVSNTPPGHFPPLQFGAEENYDPVSPLARSGNQVLHNQHLSPMHQPPVADLQPSAPVFEPTTCEVTGTLYPGMYSQFLPREPVHSATTTTSASASTASGSTYTAGGEGEEEEEKYAGTKRGRKDSYVVEKVEVPREVEDQVCAEYAARRAKKRKITGDEVVPPTDLDRYKDLARQNWQRGKKAARNQLKQQMAILAQRLQLLKGEIDNGIPEKELTDDATDLYVQENAPLYKRLFPMLKSAFGGDSTHDQAALAIRNDTLETLELKVPMTAPPPKLVLQPHSAKKNKKTRTRRGGKT
ncbi:hypothetical protein Pelo_11248 [Pelomyxa schiedti]|nr:hypothetical protein Pelo_11248 [Pelomyxa schiedti]